MYDFKLTDGNIQVEARRQGVDVLIYDESGLAWSLVDTLDDDGYKALMAQFPVEGTYWGEFFTGADVHAVAEQFKLIKTMDDAIARLEEIS